MKKIAAIILACSLLTTSLFCGIEVTADPVDTYFTDIKGHWAEQTLLEMVEDGLIIGRTETEFDPDAFVTSAEFVTMCIRVQGGEKFLGDRKTFQDVNHGDWFYQDIETAVDRGLVKPADYFIPNEPITRERMATIAYRAYGKDEISSELSFIDADEIADYAKEPVAKAVQAGLIQGMDDGTFLPKAGTTRAQAAVVINRLHQKTAESPLPSPEESPSPAEPTASPIPSISPSPSSKPSSGGGGGGGGGCGGIVPSTPSPSIQPSPSIIPSQCPEISASPSASPSIEPSVSPTIPIVGFPQPNFCHFYRNEWNRGGIKGPIYEEQGQQYQSETAYTDKTGAVATYGVKESGMVNIYTYIIKSDDGKDDTNVKYLIYCNGNGSEVNLDYSKLETGYHYLGTYEFVESGFNVVGVKRESSDETLTRISTVRFDFLKEQEGETPQYDENSEIEKSVYISPYALNGKVQKNPFAETSIAQEQQEQWENIFFEDFNGPQLDNGIWTAADKAPGYHTLSSRWMDNLAIQDGILNIAVKKEERPVETSDGTVVKSPYTSGAISSNESFGYGYFEAKYQCTASEGINNSFWLMTKGGIVNSGDHELDISEVLYPNILNNNYFYLDPNIGLVREAKTFPMNGMDLSSEMNIYWAEWDANEIKYGINDKMLRKADNINSKNPVRLNLSVSVMDFNNEAADTIDGTSMKIDWVKVYRKK